MPCCQEKPLGSLLVTVPQTDTGGQGENPKARERTLVKEFGKITPYLRKKECPGWCDGLPVKLPGVAEKRQERLFTKNTGLC